jgi:hypothetical protein
MGPHLIAAAIGVWMMFAPAVLGYGGEAATSDYVVGPLIASFGLIAAWEITRALRVCNLVLGAWLATSPLYLSHLSRASLLNAVVCGAAVFALSLVRGKSKHRFGGGWAGLLD